MPPRKSKEYKRKVSKNFGAGKALREGPVPVYAESLPSGPRESNVKKLVKKDLEKLPRSLKLLLKTQEQRLAKDTKTKGSHENLQGGGQPLLKSVPRPSGSGYSDAATRKKRKSRVSQASMDKIKAFEESLVRAKKQRTAKHTKYLEKRREQKKNRRQGPVVKEIVVSPSEAGDDPRRKGQSLSREDDLALLEKDLPHVEHIPFLDVAHAPPRLQFSERLLRRKEKESRHHPALHPGPSKHQQESIEAMRRQAVQQYRLAKVFRVPSMHERNLPDCHGCHLLGAVLA
eukprot:scaffold1504_cov417-Prasinococcus_capsulatus_cf.AAC.60